MAKISVIMPVYNGEKYIRQAIDSLLAQTFQDWELIVVDDGSTDSTPQILSSYSEPRIHAYHQDNAGVAAARNNGLSHAGGEYVAFLDADDGYLPDAFADLSAFLDQHPEYGVVLSDGFVCDENGQHLMRLTEHRPGIVTGDVLESIALDPAYVTVPACTLTRWSVIESSGSHFDSNLSLVEDWDFWIQLARCTHFGYLDKTTCIYRLHQTNSTSTASQARRRQVMIRLRYKVFNSNWFEQLSNAARSRFLYILVLQYLDGQKDEQLAILRSRQVSELSLDQQALLWRQAGRQLLQREKQPSFARLYFQESLRRDPRNWKARGLLLLSQTDLPIVPPALAVWHAIHRALKPFTAIGKKRSRPIPIKIER